MNLSYNSKQKEQNSYESWKQKEKELSLQIDSLRKINDSIKSKVISNEFELIKIESDYEKNCSILISQPLSNQFEFFTNYIEHH